jgi:intron-binding protein aquarius
VPELRPAFDQLLARPDELQVVVGEMFDSTLRKVDDEKVESTTMEGVEHLGQYVFEMTQAKVKSLKEGREKLPEIEATAMNAEDDEDDQHAIEEEMDMEVHDEDLIEDEETEGHEA